MKTIGQARTAGPERYLPVITCLALHSAEVGERIDLWHLHHLIQWPSGLQPVERLWVGGIRRMNRLESE